MSFNTIQTSVNAQIYVWNPRYSLLADEGSAGLRSHERLSDKDKYWPKFLCVPHISTTDKTVDRKNWFSQDRVGWTSWNWCWFVREQYILDSSNGM